MADDNQDPVMGRSKREPPTIDLEATDTSPGATSGTEPETAQEPPKRRHVPVIAIIAVATVGLLGAGLWAVTSNVETVTTDSGDRLARLESQIRELADHPVTDTKAFDDVAARLRRMETALANPANTTDAALASRLTAEEAKTKTLADADADLNRRADESAAALREARTQIETLTRAVGELTRQNAATTGQGDLDALGKRIAALETATQSFAAGNTSDRAARQIAVAVALKSAIDRGNPFRAELGAFKPIASNPKQLAALEPFMDSGIPGVPALLKDFSAHLPGIQQSVHVTPAGSGLIERLQANAERLVRVRPINDAQGDDAGAVAARLEARIAQGDLAGAVTEANKLPPAARAPLDPLIAKTAARAAALAASDRLVADSLAGLAQSGAAQR